MAEQSGARARAGSSNDPEQPDDRHLRKLLSFASPAPEDRHLDHRIHERMRLGILSALAVNNTMDFKQLKGLLSATDGNLSVHARKLEEAGFIACKKSFQGRTPRTSYRITAAGRRALSRYLDHMEALIRTVRSE